MVAAAVVAFGAITALLVLAPLRSIYKHPLYEAPERLVGVSLPAARVAALEGSAESPVALRGALTRISAAYPVRVERRRWRGTRRSSTCTSWLLDDRIAC